MSRGQKPSSPRSETTFTRYEVPGEGSDITNTATATVVTTDPNPANNTSSVTNVPGGVAAPRADVTMTKRYAGNAAGDPAAPIVPGATFSYAIDANNNGPSIAVNVAVTDQLPAELAFVSSPDGCTAPVETYGALITCPTVPAVPIGQSGQDIGYYTLVVRLNPAYTGAGTGIVNSATATGATADPLPGNNTGTQGIPPGVAASSADVSLTKDTASDAQVHPGESFDYVLTAANAGPSTATAVVVTDQLPLTLRFTSSPDACTATGQAVSCPAIPLAPAASRLFTVRVTLDPSYSGDGSDISNVATATSPVSDPDPDNNKDSMGVPGGATLPPSSDLSIVKRPSTSDAVVPGNTFAYTITVSNTGPGTARNVVVTDPLRQHRSRSVQQHLRPGRAPRRHCGAPSGRPDRRLGAGPAGGARRRDDTHGHGGQLRPVQQSGARPAHHHSPAGSRDRGPAAGRLHRHGFLLGATGSRHMLRSVVRNSAGSSGADQGSIFGNLLSAGRAAHLPDPDERGSGRRWPGHIARRGGDDRLPGRHLARQRHCGVAVGSARAAGRSGCRQGGVGRGTGRSGNDLRLSRDGDQPRAFQRSRSVRCGQSAGGLELRRVGRRLHGGWAGRHVLGARGSGGGNQSDLSVLSRAGFRVHRRNACQCGDGALGHGRPGPGQQQRAARAFRRRSARDRDPAGLVPPTVRNDGDTAFPDILVAQLLPQALIFEESNVESATIRAGEIQWRQPLPAHGEIVLHVRGKVGAASEQWPKLTTTSCVRADAQSSLVCASDSDPIGPPQPDRRLWWLGGAGIVVIAAAVIWWRRKA